MFRGALRDKLLRKLRSVIRPKHRTSATCNAIFSSIVRQVAEKIAQCNRAFAVFLESINVSRNIQSNLHFTWIFSKFKNKFKNTISASNSGLDP